LRIILAFLGIGQNSNGREMGRSSLTKNVFNAGLS
jgi:hypothetical protein